MQILPVRDLNCALHEFVDRDDKMAFHSCLQVKIEKKGDIPSQISEYPKFQTV
jgi:double-strand break repair protein MRE11